MDINAIYTWKGTAKIMKTSEKVAYIKGLMEGMALDMTKSENRILSEVVGVLEELAATNNALTEENIKLKDYVEELDHDLGELEEYVYDFDCRDDYDFDDEDSGDEDAEYGEETYSEDEEEDN